jgi:hypothetical protein
MRYTVYEKKVDKDHPYLTPGQTLYYLLDTFKQRLSLGCYTTTEKADYWCERKNAI